MTLETGDLRSNGRKEGWEGGEGRGGAVKCRFALDHEEFDINLPKQKRGKSKSKHDKSPFVSFHYCYCLPPVSAKDFLSHIFIADKVIKAALTG